MTDDILDSRYSWVRLGISLLIGVIGSVGMWMVIAVLPSLQSDFGLDRAQAAFPYVFTMVGFGIGNFWIGSLLDRLDIRKTLLISNVVIATGFLSATYSPNVWILSILHFVIGIGTAASFGPLIADISQWFMKRRGIAVAIAASANYLSGAIWPVVFSGVQADHGWRMVYTILAIMVPVTVIPLSFLLKRKLPLTALQRATEAAAQRAQDSGLSPFLLMALIGTAAVACCVAMSMPQIHIVALCVDLGFGPAVGTQMLSLMLLGGVASRIVSGLLADRLGGLNTLIIGSAAQMVALFLYLPFDGLVPLYLISTLFGLAQGGIVPSYAVIVREYIPPNQAGSKVGFAMMATVLGMALGGWMSGWIYEQTGSYTLAFWNGIGWNLLNLSIAFLILWRTTRSQNATA